MRSEARRELLASRADVWGFLAEPYHLSDWFPGITGVQPDRRGFAPGARWQVHGTRWTNPFTGRRPVDQLLVIREIAEYESWRFHLVAERLDVEVRLRALAPDRTEVGVAVEGGWLVGGRRSLAQKAVERLHALVQTAGDY
ncbi:MAG TPA: SRPBCC family protein [Gaiellaceae bacterium]